MLRRLTLNLNLELLHTVGGGSKLVSRRFGQRFVVRGPGLLTRGAARSARRRAFAENLQVERGLSKETPRIVSLLPSATEIVCALGLEDSWSA